MDFPLLWLSLLVLPVCSAFEKVMVRPKGVSVTMECGDVVTNYTRVIWIYEDRLTKTDCMVDNPRYVIDSAILVCPKYLDYIIVEQTEVLKIPSAYSEHNGKYICKLFEPFLNRTLIDSIQLYICGSRWEIFLYVFSGIGGFTSLFLFGFVIFLRGMKNEAGLHHLQKELSGIEDDGYDQLETSSSKDSEPKEETNFQDDYNQIGEVGKVFYRSNSVDILSDNPVYGIQRMSCCELDGDDYLLPVNSRPKSMGDLDNVGFMGRVTTV